MCVTNRGPIPSDPCGDLFGPTHTSVAIEVPPRSTRRSPPNASLNPPPAADAASTPPPSCTTHAASLFDALDTPHEDPSLLEDLVALVALGLLEERSSPEGPVFALTELALRMPGLARFGVAPYDRVHVPQYPPAPQLRPTRHF
jgi:hypothetical protein